eukprot:1671008-Prymnesium_polylepis.1
MNRPPRTDRRAPDRRAPTAAHRPPRTDHRVSPSIAHHSQARSSRAARVRRRTRSPRSPRPVSYTHLRAHETLMNL